LLFALSKNGGKKNFSTNTNLFQFGFQPGKGLIPGTQGFLETGSFSSFRDSRRLVRKVPKIENG